MSIKNDPYSKEEHLLEFLGYGHLIEFVPTIDARDLFICNAQGESVDSLRRILKAIHDCFPCRGSDEYLDLIVIPGGKHE
jgi:hypothetical protein